MIMPPDETDLPPGVGGFTYTTFPTLQDELFTLGQPELPVQRNDTQKKKRSDSFVFGRRTKQEVRNMQKVRVSFL